MRNCGYTWLLIFWGIVSFSALTAQVKDGHVETNAAKTVSGPTSDSTLMKKHSPMKAALMSAVVPGLGQIYNRKYWKLPIVYGLGGGFIYLAVLNNKNYQLYRETFITRIDTTYNGTDYFPEIPDVAPNTALQAEMERTRKNMELAIIGAVLIYALQIVDASVDAHLKYFDVSDDLSMMVKPKVYLPQLQTAFQSQQKPMLGVQLNFRIK